MYINEVLCERKDSVVKKQEKGLRRVQQASQQGGPPRPHAEQRDSHSPSRTQRAPKADQETLLWQNPWETLLPKNTPIFPAPLKHRQNKGYRFKAYTF